jgi:hypothetical protein
VLRPTKRVLGGTDPSENRKAMKSARADRAANSFEVVAREWFAKYSATWAANHRNRIEFVYLTRKVNFEDLDYDLKPREAWPFLKRCTIRLWQDFDARSRP